MRVPRRRRRRWIALVWILVVGLVAGSCSVERALPAPSCIEGDSGIIVAQSVPGADLVPCLGTLPAGWSVDSVDITDQGTRIRFDSDRAGESAAHLNYNARCEIGDAVTVPSENEGAAAYEYIERLQPGFKGARYFEFVGGCAWWEFDFDDGASAALSIELGTALDFVTRSDLNEGIRQSFIDEEV